MITPAERAELEHRFSYHPPTPDQVPKFEAIRAAAKELATLIVFETPSGREQELALDRLDEVVFHANSSIARRQR